MTRIGAVLGLIALVVVAGCSRDRQPQLLNLARDSGPGPDEFSILPTEPLQMPDDLASLPEPTPGGTNRVDPDPEADAIIALGGNPDRAPGAGGLVTYAARFGISDGIRDVLAAEDLDYRRRNDGRLLERLFNVNVYHRAYERVSLDQYAELERLRRAGVRTPAAPPEGFQR
ncbi:DUF3035 domain-containing protein [Rhodobacterales bacterium HKCCE3408]|nr:DUF3035 domain-containing protein [Rhodobacterales bacterium HKCCE3408]